MQFRKLKGAGPGRFLAWVVGLIVGLSFFSSSIGTALNGVAGLTNTTLYGAGGVAMFGLTGLIVASIFIIKILKGGGIM